MDLRQLIPGLHALSALVGNTCLIIRRIRVKKVRILKEGKTERINTQVIPSLPGKLFQHQAELPFRGCG